MNLLYCSLSILLLLGINSCQRYDSLQMIDPMYVEKSVDISSFRDSPENYLQRTNDAYFQSSGFLKPKKSETFEKFKDRIFNTLVIKEYENEQVSILINKKLQRIGSLKEQLAEVQGIYAEKHLKLISSQFSIEEVASEDADSSRLFKKYIVERGDTLQKISANFYGIYCGWLMIYLFNLDKLPYGPNRIKENDKLFVPNIDFERDLHLHEMRRAAR